jgi:hypothetical protein
MPTQQGKRSLRYTSGCRPAEHAAIASIMMHTQIHSAAHFAQIGDEANYVGETPIYFVRLVWYLIPRKIAGLSYDLHRMSREQKKPYIFYPSPTPHYDR